MANHQAFEYFSHLVLPTQEGWSVTNGEGKIWQCLSVKEARKTIAFFDAAEPVALGAD